ncbi:MAG TPA: tetratricopeptide repeat protein [Bdellovibrionales bacterium]|nr:tetratricopeptide repeat protein [Bdellovibrionales bacterium]
MSNTNVPGGTYTPASQLKKPAQTAPAVNPTHWAEEHAKLIVSVAVGAIVVALGFIGWQYLGKRQERTAQDAYYAVAQKYEKAREEFERAKFNEFAPADQKTPGAKAATGDLQKDYGTIVTDLESVARDHAGTAAGAQAAILASNTYIEYKQPEKAIEISRMTADKLSDSHTLKQLTNMMLGNALAAKGDCQEAVTVWQKIIDNSKATFLHGDASLRAGLCFELLGKNDQALEMYRKASASESGAASTARGLMRALEVKSKTPAKG